MIKRLSVLAALLTLSAFGGTAPSAAFHFALDRSAPEAGSTVHEVSEVRLWFTEEPQENTTSIRVIDADGEMIHTDDVAQDTEDPTSFGVALHGPLTAGTYTVSWRGLGDDGHPVRDDFTFTVAAH